MRADPAQTALELCNAAQLAPSLTAWRGEALSILSRAIRFERALFHELTPTAPLARAASVDIDLSAVERMRSSWDEYAVSFERLLRTALSQGGAAIEAEAFGPSGRARGRWNRAFARPLGLHSTLLAHLVVDARIVSVVLLARTRDPVFSRRDRERITALLPALAVGDAMHQARDGPHGAGVATTLRCCDGRLTERQREVVEHVALGLTNEQIGRVLGVSPHTVRNLLSSVRERLGVANRAEVIHRAAFR